MDIFEYLDGDGVSAFRPWFDNLNAPAAAKVTVSITRLSLGNTSHVKGVGAGVLELKIDFAKGYRVYFDKDGEQLVILLGGGTKDQQQRDIEKAQERWLDYKARKKGNA